MEPATIMEALTLVGGAVSALGAVAVTAFWTILEWRHSAHVNPPEP
jgi:hypothetical protein